MTLGYSDTATSSAVSVATGDSTATLAAAAGRKQATVFNDGVATVYLSLGATASTTVYTVQILPYGYYETPAGYRGIVTHKGSAATGTLRIVELT